MNHNKIFLFTIYTILVTIICACSSGGGVTSSEEESGIELALDEIYAAVRNGARLYLSYNVQSSSFDGFVENTTDTTLKQVRVEVHLSNGVELGPTTPVDLQPGEKVIVTLQATSQSCNWWTAHPEVGIGEHGSGSEGNGEHGSKGNSEHDRRESGEHDEGGGEHGGEGQ